MLEMGFNLFFLCLLVYKENFDICIRCKVLLILFWVIIFENWSFVSVCKMELLN